ncbi:hypothetical protein V6N13_059637 [Hibiscus sabdariffa]
MTSFVPSANDVVYEGDAHPSLGNIELNTVDRLCRVGRAVYSEPIRIWDSSTMTLADFTSQFSFTINTRNVSVYGNGFAFFLAPVGYQIPPNSAGGYLGLLNSSTMADSFPTQVVSVEFDSYVNADWDPKTEHVGINNNSMRSAVFAKWDAGSNSGKVAIVWITYNATTKNLSVFWTYDEHPVFIANSSLSYVIYLMEALHSGFKLDFRQVQCGQPCCCLGYLHVGSSSCGQRRALHVGHRGTGCGAAVELLTGMVLQLEHMKWARILMGEVYQKGLRSNNY